MEFEKPAVEGVEDKAAKRRERGAEVYKDSYDVAIKLRDFDKGWSEYEDKEGTPFGTQVSQIGERCRNIATSAIREGGALNTEFLEEEVEKIIAAREQLIKFEAQADLEAFSETLLSRLDTLRADIKSGDAMKVFRSSVELRSYYEGFMNANEYMLADAELALHDQN